ncbi:MAG: LysM peptidoglycan-binding domain-containing protein [Deltaproteobacteria bacterium]|nr:LysM peptidoglycan-binding domain-containing protein [Deltaproteobacteria bacterium]
MNSNDSFKDNQTEKIPVDDYFDGIEHSSFQKRKIGFNFPKIMGMPLFIIGGGVIILIIFTGIVLNKTGETLNVSEQERGIEARIKKMEDRLVDMEKLEQKLVGLESQGKKLGLLQNRMDRLEANLASKLNRISSRLESSIDKKLKDYAKRAPVGNKKKIVSKTVGKHHKVHSGETLYGIGLNYNLSLEELYRLNPSLSRNSSIHPGQKIRISAN